MINFLDPKLLPKITGKPPCSENYEPENLISTHYSNKSRGFIAFPSIKPPIELEFELICNVIIRYIFLNTSVGSQKCSGIQILVKDSVTPHYVPIGRAIYDSNIRRVIFCDKRKYSATNPPPCYDSKDTALYFFTSGTYKSFLNASSVKIVIFRTEKSVPCLAAVEIWGFPSKTCSKKTIDTVYRLKDSKNTSKLLSSKSGPGNDDFKIPDEFKDDLTYELMTIPYTLPSGKTIDQTTLEKHVESEKSFGRKPCDPFTGIKFTETLKPILNVGLKSRIDMFLLGNSHRTETFCLKRTLRVVNCVSKKIQVKYDINNAPNSSNNDDLDDLIKKVKSDPNFMSFTEGSNCIEKNCVSCKKTHEYLYELPCEHNYCRKCLLEVCESCRCKQCDKTFLKSDVKRIEFI